MGAIGRQRRDRVWHRLHYPDGAHRETANSTVEGDVAWFAENMPLHMEQHEMETEQWAHSAARLRGLPEGHRLYTRVVKISPLDGPAHVIVRYPFSVVGDPLSIEWVNIEPALIGCTRSDEAGAYVLNETGIDAAEEIVHRIGKAMHGDRNYFTSWSL